MVKDKAYTSKKRSVCLVPYTVLQKGKIYFNLATIRFCSSSGGNGNNIGYIFFPDTTGCAEHCCFAQIHATQRKNQIISINASCRICCNERIISYPCFRLCYVDTTTIITYSTNYYRFFINKIIIMIPGYPVSSIDRYRSRFHFSISERFTGLDFYQVAKTYPCPRLWQIERYLIVDTTLDSVQLLIMRSLQTGQSTCNVGTEVKHPILLTNRRKRDKEVHQFGSAETFP